MGKTKIIIISIITIILIGVLLKFGGLFATFGSAESQFKLEYNTVYSDETDGRINLGICESTIVDGIKDLESYSQTQQLQSSGDTGCFNYATRFGDSPGRYYQDNLWILKGRAEFTDNGNEVGVVTQSGGPRSGSLQTRDSFKGQEVIAIYSGGADGDSGQSISTCSFLGVTPNCNLNVADKRNILCQDTVVRYVPDTLDLTKYDVIQDGVLVNKISAPEGIKPTVGCTYSDGRTVGAGQLKYVGTKARFCDIRDDEVWIQRSFSSPVNLQVLDEEFGEVPTQFCHEARPFTLRKLGEGEAPLKKAEGIIPFNRGETIQADEENIITLNYALNIETCQSEGCTKCGLGKSNIFKNGRWTCENFLREDEPRTIGERELVIPTGTNIFSAANTVKIGDVVFSSKQKFTCSPGEGIWSPPNPSLSCYESEIQYNNIDTVMKDSQKMALNPNLKVQYYAGGKYIIRSDGTQNDLSGSYVFEVINPIELRFKEIDSTTSEMVFIVKNNMPTNELLIKTSQSVERTESNLVDERFEFVVSKDEEKELRVPINVENLGINNVELHTFYPITIVDNTILIPGQGFRFGFDNIVQEGETVVVTQVQEVIVEKEVTIETIKEVEQTIEIEKKESNIFLFVGIGLLVFLGLLLAIWKLK